MVADRAGHPGPMPPFQIEILTADYTQNPRCS